MQPVWQGFGGSAAAVPAAAAAMATALVMINVVRHRRFGKCGTLGSCSSRRRACPEAWLIRISVTLGRTHVLTRSSGLPDFGCQLVEQLGDHAATLGPPQGHNTCRLQIGFRSVGGDGSAVRVSNLQLLPAGKPRCTGGRGLSRRAECTEFAKNLLAINFIPVPTGELRPTCNLMGAVVRSCRAL